VAIRQEGGDWVTVAEMETTNFIWFGLTFDLSGWAGLA